MWFWFYAAKYSQRNDQFGKYQTIQMLNFCSTLPINLKFAPDVTQNKVFEWMVFGGGSFGVGLYVT